MGATICLLKRNPPHIILLHVTKIFKHFFIPIVLDVGKTVWYNNAIEQLESKEFVWQP